MYRLITEQVYTYLVLYKKAHTIAHKIEHIPILFMKIGGKMNII